MQAAHTPVAAPPPPPRFAARVGRLRYLNLLAATVVGALVVLLLLCLALRTYPGGVAIMGVWMAAGMVIWQQIAAAVVSVWRLHDVGRSGLWALIWLMPYGGVVAMLYLLFAPGNAVPNRFGPVPAQPGAFDKVAGAVVLASLLALAVAGWWLGPLALVVAFMDGLMALGR
ncbi:DUF805 domain-containing protein [[Empedobacter] haloabium]|uniref:DUF805 domain-containing protein n=1 Tax=[Empedobacter] haloabium TaxID=592317 RepID=A0ABZ1UJ92_9BURK